MSIYVLAVICIIETIVGMGIASVVYKDNQNIISLLVGAMFVIILTNGTIATSNYLIAENTRNNTLKLYSDMHNWEQLGASDYKYDGSGAVVVYCSECDTEMAVLKEDYNKYMIKKHTEILNNINSK